jgi:hypothetical protein
MRIFQCNKIKYSTIEYVEVQRCNIQLISIDQNNLRTHNVFPISVKAYVSVFLNYLSSHKISYKTNILIII